MRAGKSSNTLESREEFSDDVSWDDRELKYGRYREHVRCLFRDTYLRLDGLASWIRDLDLFGVDVLQEYKNALPKRNSLNLWRCHTTLLSLQRPLVCNARQKCLDFKHFCARVRAEIPCFAKGEIMRKLAFRVITIWIFYFPLLALLSFIQDAIFSAYHLETILNIALQK